MNKTEARALLTRKVEELRNHSYDELVAHMEPRTEEVRGPVGVDYQIETQAFWDDRSSKNLRVMVSIDDGGFSSFAPMSSSFIMAPDGSFVGE